MVEELSNIKLLETIVFECLGKAYVNLIFFLEDMKEDKFNCIKI